MLDTRTAHVLNQYSTMVIGWRIATQELDITITELIELMFKHRIALPIFDGVNSEAMPCDVARILMLGRGNG